MPPEAWAEIDCRLLPDEDPTLFMAELGRVIGRDIQHGIHTGGVVDQFGDAMELEMELEAAHRHVVSVRNAHRAPACHETEWASFPRLVIGVKEAP